MLDMAGVGNRVEIIVGIAKDVLPQVAKKVPRADLVFEDHLKQSYAPDLKQMEALGMVVPGTWVVADNVVHPGAPGFLEHVIPANGYESTELLKAKFEYEEPWREGDVGAQEDAISLSKFVGLPTSD
jgi:catechol O-methyltransferase